MRSFKQDNKNHYNYRRGMISLGSCSSLYVFMSLLLLLLGMMIVPPVSCFSSYRSTTISTTPLQQRHQLPTQSSSSFLGTRYSMKMKKKQQQQRRGNAKSELNMFMGSDGGILGVGTPELFTILLVGYFVLGPSDLYKLTKEIGKFVQNFRTFTTEATATFENTMESQLQLEEIRKAQAELTDAFSFRRSINVDEEMEAFEVNAQSPRETATAAVAATATTAAATTTGEAADDDAPKKKKKIRRRRVKRRPPPEETAEVPSPSIESELPVTTTPVQTTAPIQNNIPDLDMTEAFTDSSTKSSSAASTPLASVTKEEEATLAAEEAAYDALQAREDSMMAELEAANEQFRKEEEEAAKKARMERLRKAVDPEGAQNSAEQAAANNRFQSQLSGSWNDQILGTDPETLQPLEDIMKQLAILEEEKLAADKRLQEEFAEREANEEKFYRQKRELLQSAISQVQTDVNSSMSSAAAKK